MNWDKQIHDFGLTDRNLQLTTSFQYLGDLDLSTKDFSASCGCTTPLYNQETKTLSIGLNVGANKGIKTSSVRCVPTNEVLILKATIQ